MRFTKEHRPKYAVYTMEYVANEPIRTKLVGRYGSLARAIVVRDTLVEDGFGAFLDVN